MSKGLLITFEGGDKSGKTTQSGLLADYLRSLDLQFITTHEPGGSKLAEDIRTVLLSVDSDDLNDVSELLLFYAARCDHIEKIIKPALDKGKIVLCDRFFDSSYAYQYEVIKKHPKLAQTLDKTIVKDCIPDRSYFLLMSAEKWQQRKYLLSKLDRFDKKTQEFHLKIHKRFAKLASQNRERCKIIDAAQSLNEVSRQIITDFKEKFGDKFAVDQQ